jgi:hypothetical protein
MSGDGGYRLLAWFALAAAIGTLAELALERHWDGTIQRVPWAVAGLIVLAAAAWLARPSGMTRRFARMVAAVAIAGSVFGAWEHIAENHAAGPLDFRYAASWESLPAAEQWWKAATKAVGPAPVLAPGILAFAGLLALASTFAPARGEREP